MDIDKLYDKYVQKRDDDDIVAEVRRLLSIMAKEHIVLDDTIKYTWQNNILSLYIIGGEGYIRSKNWFKFPGMRRNVKRYVFRDDTIHILPTYILKIIKDELVKHIDEMNKSIDELYKENSSAILNYSLSTGGERRISCPIHGQRCGEMITKLRTLIAGLLYDIYNIASSGISADMSIFDEIVLIKRTPVGNIEFRCYSFFQPRLLSSFPIVLSPSDLNKMFLSTSSIEGARELANFRKHLYNSTRIQPITLNFIDDGGGVCCNL